MFEDLRLVYRGQFVNDMKEGFGTITSERSSIPKEMLDLRNEVEEDAVTKKSVYHFEGTFNKDKKEGDGQLYARGIWVSKLGNSSVLGTMSAISESEKDNEQQLISEKYSGNFSNDAFHGEGIYIDSQGKVHEGIFKHGKMVMQKLQNNSSSQYDDSTNDIKNET